MNTPETPVKKSFTNMHELKKNLNSLGKSWALTGSQAMRLHARALHRESRVPHNINLLVNRSNFPNFVRFFQMHGYSFHGPPPVALTHRNIVSMYKNNNTNKGVNMLASGRLGPRLGPNTIENVLGIPVVKIQHLINYKRKSLNSVNNTTKAKIEANINFLQRLIRPHKRKINL
jgi:hypothetical protein